jgi:hypothetical protein
VSISIPCILRNAELVFFLCKSWLLILEVMAPSLPSQSRM